MIRAKVEVDIIPVYAISACEATRVAIRIGVAQHDDPSQVGVDITLIVHQSCESDKSGNSLWGLLSSMIRAKKVDIITDCTSQRLRKTRRVATRIGRAQDVDQSQVEES